MAETYSLFQPSTFVLEKNLVIFYLQHDYNEVQLKLYSDSLETESLKLANMRAERVKHVEILGNIFGPKFTLFCIFSAFCK